MQFLTLARDTIFNIIIVLTWHAEKTLLQPDRKELKVLVYIIAITLGGKCYCTTTAKGFFRQLVRDKGAASFASLRE